MRQVREALLPLLDLAADRGLPKLMVEPSAGGGRSLAARVEERERFPAKGVRLHEPVFQVEQR